ncbi:MAG: hypothetical protein JWP27_2450 [Flaviaesturariibacter sp.]|nr:hypothetical protein [Flaviaesturariibacter sp.]
MKAILVSACFILLLSLSSHAQVASGDARLDARLKTYLEYNRDLNFERVMDYIHPSIFKIAPRADLVKLFSALFNDQALRAGFDSLQLTTISAPFKSGAATYRFVSYYNVITLAFRDSSVYENPAFESTVLQGLQKSFDTKTVRYDKATGKFYISGTDSMLAILDPGKPWFFLGFQKKQPELTRRLFPQAVIAHFKLL